MRRRPDSFPSWYRFAAVRAKNRWLNGQQGLLRGQHRGVNGTVKRSTLAPRPNLRVPQASALRRMVVDERGKLGGEVAEPEMEWQDR